MAVSVDDGVLAGMAVGGGVAVGQGVVVRGGVKVGGNGCVGVGDIAIGEETSGSVRVAVDVGADVAIADNGVSVVAGGEEVGEGTSATSASLSSLSNGPSHKNQPSATAANTSTMVVPTSVHGNRRRAGVCVSTVCCRGCPHLMQNRAESSFGAAHLGQNIRPPSRVI